MRKLKSLLTVTVLLAFVFGLRAEVVFLEELRTVESHKIAVGNLLHWKTSFERNIEHYVVQKSLDGRNYFDVGEKITPQLQQKKVNTYNFLDITAPKKVYYRLKVVEKNIYNFTEPLFVERAVANEIIVTNLLTPEVKDFLKLEYGSTTNKPIQYQLLNADNQIISNDIVITQKGFNSFILSLKDKPKGLYKLKLINGQEVDEVLITKTTDISTSNGRL